MAITPASCHSKVAIFENGSLYVFLVLTFSYTKHELKNTYVQLCIDFVLPLFHFSVGF